MHQKTLHIIGLAGSYVLTGFKATFTGHGDWLWKITPKDDGSGWTITPKKLKLKKYQMEELITILQNFGFPVSVAIFLLISFQKTIQGSTKEICNMIEKMIEIKKFIG